MYGDNCHELTVPSELPTLNSAISIPGQIGTK
jgi:hypothetical protein